MECGHNPNLFSVAIHLYSGSGHTRGDTGKGGLCMEELKERMAYIRGLTAGVDLNHTTPEGRILVEMMDLMHQMVKSIDLLQDSQGNMEEYVAAIDEDLTDLENDFYDEYDEAFGDFEVTDSDSDDDMHINYVEMECPNCQETVFVDQDVFNDDAVVEVLCPECHETILVNDDTPVTTS
jgi:ribosomal protein S27E